MSKHQLNLRVAHVEHPHPDYAVLHLTLPLAERNLAPTGEGGAERCQESHLPPMHPGQFVQVRVEGSPATFLRRPISINYADATTLHLLVHNIGAGTAALCALREGDTLNCLLPLGHGYTLPAEHTPARRCLLIGGGVGTAPLLYLAARLHELGHNVTLILGGRSAGDVLQTELFKQYGRLCITTNDGTLGHPGFVTQHPVLDEAPFDQIYTCGPKPMMQAVVRWAREHHTPCEVSLENMMACGLGACLCCVENTVRGNVCVCTEGPVFDEKELNW